jgi:SAM-dependent methyltransferase
MIDYSSDEIFDFLINEAKAHFSGWDFSYIADREAQAPLRWSYVSEALLRVRKSGVVLDMETGGGEMFSRFAPFPTKAYATEGYAPNVQLARQRLESLGVQVIQIDEEEGGPQYLPFEDQFFDLVLNRHGYYWPPELYRILRPGGVFLTQQVGDNNDVGMRCRISTGKTWPKRSAILNRRVSASSRSWKTSTPSGSTMSALSSTSSRPSPGRSPILQ